MENKYTITKEQLRQLTDPVVKEWFPEVFKTDLEVGKWYFQTDSKALINFQGGKSGYGFCANGNWNDLSNYWSFKEYRHEWREATKQEVFETLKNEAVRRGFKEEFYFKCLKNGNIISCDGLFGFSKNTLYSNRGVVFYNGQWAEIIPTLTKEEAEEKFNVKII